MIKATDLRIGNYVMPKLSVKSHWRMAVRVDGLFIQQCEKEGLVDNYDHIPITEDWLLRFGFERRLINNAFFEYYINCTPPNYKRDFVLSFTFGMLSTTPKGVCDRESWYPWMSSGDSHSFNIQSIHQLQNVFFAITGKELELKVPI